MPKVTGNSNCTPQQRCGHCTRDIQAAIKRRIDAARAASMALSGDQRICCDCGQPKPIDDFPAAKQHRHRFRCSECHQVCRTIWNAQRSSRVKVINVCIDKCGTRVGKKATRCWPCYNKLRARPAQKPAPKLNFKCIGGCGLLVSKADVRCIPCKRERQVMIAASSEHKIKTKKVLSSLKSGSAHAVMFVGDEALTLSNRCSWCRKPILITGLCYKHATGREITIPFRPRIVSDPAEISMPPDLVIQ